MTTWNEDNLLPLMETRNARLLEYTVKDAIKMGNKNLTPEQRDEIYKAFTMKPDAFKKTLKSLSITSGDSLLDWTYEDFQTRILSQLNANAGKNVRTGIEGLVEGKDYIELGRGEEYGGWVAYLLLSFKGAQTLATNRVEPKIKIRSSNSKEMVEKATWCTAAAVRSFFTYVDSNYLVDLFRFDPELPDKEKKIQFSVGKDTFKVVDIFNAEDRQAKGVMALRKFIISNILPSLKNYQEVASKRIEDYTKEYYAQYLNPETLRYDLPVQELFVSNDEIPLPIGVLFGKGEEKDSIYIRLESLQNFPREIKDCSLRVGSANSSIWENQSPLLPDVKIDQAVLDISQFTKKIAIQDLVLENKGKLVLNADQYLSLDPKEGQSILDSMLGPHPDQKVVRQNLKFEEYLKLKHHGYELPEVKVWWSGNYSDAGGDLISGYTFDSFRIDGENIDPGQKKTLILDNLIMESFTMDSAPPVELRNIQVGTYLKMLNCEYLTSLEGIAPREGNYMHRVELIGCSNLVDISSILSLNIRSIYVKDCPKIKDIVIEHFGKYAYRNTPY